MCELGVMHASDGTKEVQKLWWASAFVLAFQIGSQQAMRAVTAGRAGERIAVRCLIISRSWRCVRKLGRSSCARVRLPYDEGILTSTGCPLCSRYGFVACSINVRLAVCSRPGHQPVSRIQISRNRRYGCRPPCITASQDRCAEMGVPCGIQ